MAHTSRSMHPAPHPLAPEAPLYIRAWSWARPPALKFSSLLLKPLALGPESPHITHSLRYIYTAVTPGIDSPEYTALGLVDGEQFVYYDSNIRKMIPKTEWIKENEGEEYWNRETENQLGTQEVYKTNVVTAMQRFNQTTGECKHTESVKH
ncbi:hypothetical protein NFI96_005543 [Prochilodus magdalenae]|nr:hypothetical protein NFI96_005543 [Prochilodus magdalenae]